MAETDSGPPWGELQKARGEIQLLLSISRDDHHFQGIFSDDLDDDTFWWMLVRFIGTRESLKKYLSALDEASLEDLHAEAELLYFHESVNSVLDSNPCGFPLISLGELDNLEWTGSSAKDTLLVPGIYEIQDREKLISILTTASNEWGKERIEVTIQAAIEKRDLPVPDWLQSLL